MWLRFNLHYLFLNNSISDSVGQSQTVFIAKQLFFIYTSWACFMQSFMVFNVIVRKLGNLTWYLFNNFWWLEIYVGRKWVEMAFPMKATKDFLEVALALTITNSNALGNQQSTQLSNCVFPQSVFWNAGSWGEYFCAFPAPGPQAVADWVRYLESCQWQSLLAGKAHINDRSQCCSCVKQRFLTYWLKFQKSNISRYVIIKHFVQSLYSFIRTQLPLFI